MSLAMKARQKVKKKIVKDKVFGCDLVEHLQLSGQEVPQVLRSCAEFVEENGIVDGIYRLCGISSNVQKLRQEFDLERLPDLNKSPYLQDVHCVSSLCKAYFRELPNPLLTYQLYDKFADAVAIQLEEQRLIKIRDVLKELPAPHFRTLEYLMKHLIHVASFSAQTNMHARNLAIVWAPNLLRSRDIESSGFNGTAAFMEVRVQSIVVEFILTHVEQLFGNGSSDGNMNSSSSSMNWPTCVPEDYYRSLSYNLPSLMNPGDGPPQIRPYHTIIDFSDHKRKGSLKAKKWKSIFNLGRSNNDAKRKSTKQDDKDEKSDKISLRPAKSMDSLSPAPADANNSEQRGLTRRPAKYQAPLRRESLESNEKDASYECSGQQAHPSETNNEDQEGQAKSEPTTPKPGRASMVTTPQGRSPKTNRNRAEKCVGVHISGPFSVTLPFHITSNLSRLTRGMECPSLSYSGLHRSSERLFTPEGHVYMGSSDTDKVTLTMVSHKENSQPMGTEGHEQETDPKRMSLEVQDTFCFLQSQDMNPDETKTVCEEERPTERAAEYSADSEMLQYQHDLQVEEFSVEPPQDDPCTEDESDQMYFTPEGCLDSEDPKWHDSSEDVYLSAYDDLNPLSEKSNDHYELEEGNGENEETMKPTENDQREDKTYGGAPDTTTDGQKEAMSDTQKPFSQPDTSNKREKEDPCSPQGDPCDRPTSEVVCSREKSCKEKDETDHVHEDDTAERTEENSGDDLGDKDSVVDKGHTKMSASLNLQAGGICRTDNMRDLDTMLLNLCSPDLPISEYYDKDILLDSPEESDIYNQEMLLMNQPTLLNLDVRKVQDPRYQDVHLSHKFTLKNLDSPQHYTKDAILLSENMDSHPEEGQFLNIVDHTTLETFDNIAESECCPSDTSRYEGPEETIRMAQCECCPSDTSGYEGPGETIRMAQSECCPSDTSGYEGPGETIRMAQCEFCPSDTSGYDGPEETIRMAENTSLAELLSLLNCLEIAEDHHQEKTESPWEEPKPIIRDQRTDSSLCEPCSSEKTVHTEDLSNTVTLTDNGDTHQDRTSVPQIHNNQRCFSKEQGLSNSAEIPARSENASSINLDGSVAMKLALTPNKVQQVKSVPVVPPKPQFARLPPAFKNKLHGGSTTRDTQKSPKSDKAFDLESPQSVSDVTPRRRSSWRNATSVSFDTAMALAKERQRTQNPVRRMQTYCIGDSYEVLDSRMDHTPRFTIKPASRPLSCMSLTGDPKTLHRAQSVFQDEAYTKEQTQRLSMPRIGQQTTKEDHTARHQRRSLL